MQGRYSWREPPLHGLCFHDLRHHAITELAESQANDSIIREIAGHVSPKMLAHYSHVRMETERKVRDALSSEGSAGGGYGTKNDTNPPQDSTEGMRIIDERSDHPFTKRSGDMLYTSRLD